MIENSLDAHSTNIQITVKNGGLKLLQIQDNGTGIRKDDFAIVCERFTTSKLREFDDLQNIATYGFRGEALASISHIAHLTIVSKTCNELCAYKAHFVDGKLQGAPLPTAGNQGTIVTVEDLFFNMSVRKKALRSPAEEYQKISEVVGKYAIHNSKVGFGLRKSNENNDIRTPPDSTCVENIRIVYSNTIARELVDFELENDILKFKARGYMTNVNYSSKKFTFLLFINNRLVDCNNLKKCIDQVYATYLPKNSHPFVYLSLELDPVSVDVNVHPTKHEVHFLNEDQIVEAVCGALETRLLKSNNSRVYYTQAKLPGAQADNLPLKDTDKSKIYPKEFVRTDASEQKIEKFFGAPMSEKEGLSAPFISKVNRVDTELTSVLELRKAVEKNCHRVLRDLFAQHVFVGAINPSQALIQYSTKLFLCNTRKIMTELLYQFVLYNFQNFGFINFTKPLSVYELALQGLEVPEVGWTPEDGDKADLAQKITEILTKNGEMLNEYFSLNVDKTGRLVSLPLILDNYTPDIAGLPVYVVRLATEVTWESEKECFETVARETALYYSKMSENSKWESNDWKWVTEHVVYSAIKEYFMPPKSFTENVSVLEIANLPNLYRVFERC
ncbi:DNA mismatch repair protein Mlh1-like Protein [Tribolium castaneum]|uniref:DNA mismatch repair protein Mlh1-like Protein n=2 Tax=Tribolium castaneum TaxID=7070 RepID=D6WX75_TRICA|nr:DNA mismatch repair protein Mlh1-like Protein [Tribolium castaneum]